MADPSLGTTAGDPGSGSGQDSVGQASSTEPERSQDLGRRLQFWRSFGATLLVTWLATAAFVAGDFADRLEPEDGAQVSETSELGSTGLSPDLGQVNKYMDTAMTMRAQWASYTTAIQRAQVRSDCARDEQNLTQRRTILTEIANRDDVTLPAVDAYFEYLHKVAKRCLSGDLKRFEVVGEYQVASSLWVVAVNEAKMNGWDSDCSSHWMEIVLCTPQAK